MKIENTSPERIEALAAGQREYFRSGATLGEDFRRRQLRALGEALKRWEKPLCEALELTNKAVAEALDGLPAHKLHCSVLAEEAIRAAIKDYYDKNGIAYDPSLFPEPHEE